MIGGNLRHRRKALGLTLTELAKRMGTTAASLSRWENEERPIPKMAELLLGYLERDMRRAMGRRQGASRAKKGTR